MGRSIVVSFEGVIVRVLYGLLKGKDIVIEDALTLKDEQFDDFIEKEKAKEFIVVCSFRDFYQDTTLIPSTKDSIVRKLIEADVRKRAPFKDFTFIYTVSGEKVVENRRMKEVFVFAVSNGELNGIVNRFISKGKVVKAVYHDIFSIASQVDANDLPVLCVSEAGLNKNLFLIKDGRIQLVRTAQSIESGLSNFDVQNINMTVNYCRQTLRTNPSSVMLIGSLCNNYNATTDTLTPIACFTQKLYRIKQAVSLDFTTPFTAFLAGKSDINLLPVQSKVFFRVSMFLRYSVLLFLFLSVTGMSYGVYITKRIIEHKENISSRRNSPADVSAALSLYDAKKSELSRYAAFIKSAGDASSAPDIRGFLTLLSGLNTDNIKVKSLSVNVIDNILKVNLKGVMKTDGYAGMQRDYQGFISRITAFKGIVIKNHGVELKDKSFYVDMEWSAEGR